MKVTNWRKKLAATLLAGGMISPQAARAANLNTNLVVNGSFESVDFGVTGDYGAPQILSWLGGPAFAYSHDGTSGIPDYADGADPPGAGSWYFTANNNPAATSGDWREPNQVYQDVAVNTGASGTQIAIGEAAYNISAWMSSYLNDNDFGIVRVEFRDAGGGSLGFAEVRDSDAGPNNVWSLNQSIGLIPVGTATLRTSVYGGVVNSGTDGYIDLVDVQVAPAEDHLVFLEVNTTTGQTRIRNLTGEPVAIDYYEVSSISGALKTNTWLSLQDQNLPSFPAGNGTGNGWEEAGGSSSSMLGESFLTGNSTVANNATINLGQAYNTAAGGQDLMFQYAVVPPQPLSADFDGDGDADGRDFLIWQRGLGMTTGATKAQGDADGDSAVDADDLAIWRSEFGDSAFGGAGKLRAGFVRYVTGAVEAVPEPSSIILIGASVAALAAARKSRDVQ